MFHLIDYEAGAGLPTTGSAVVVVAVTPLAGFASTITTDSSAFDIDARTSLATMASLWAAIMGEPRSVFLCASHPARSMIDELKSVAMILFLNVIDIMMIDRKNHKQEYYHQRINFKQR